MDGVRTWAFSVSAALVACGIAQMVLPKSNLEKVFRLTVSVFILCSMLSPIIIRNPQLKIQIEEYSQQQIDIRAENLQSVVDEQTTQRARTNLKKIIEEKLTQMGIIYTGVTINMYTNGQRQGQIESVDIVLKEEHRAQHEKIHSQLESTLGLSVYLGYE